MKKANINGFYHNFKYYFKAQNVSKEKTIRVLTDILHMMFNTKFLEELFKPQHVYSRRTTRMFFEKLAHSSIMRLNETSMDKLYDLMTMAYKYQLQLCTGPEHIVLITLNHLDCVRKILPNDEILQQLLDVAHQLPMAKKFVDFFQDARVKVSLLLRENKQTDEGRFILFPDPRYDLPFNGNAPGCTRYFENGEAVRSETFPTGDEAIEYIPCSSRVKCCSLVLYTKICCGKPAKRRLRSRHKKKMGTAYKKHKRIERCILP
ncbi:unnamed protein product [Gongylonema pulchrum]|uniref:Protein OSCP1 n=1 Tax=Gongylonema pulchrum TaxID=637853 RepID=A0A183CV96_9BILA|nr:unnamed protein product [Gongylonema pulchrum]